MSPESSVAAVSWSDLERLPAERLLVLLGGVSALLFGVLAFVLQLVDRPFADGFGGVMAPGAIVLSFVLTIVFGMLLLHAFTRMATPQGAVLAFAFSLVLLVAGGFGGTVGGILGLTGAALVLLRHVRWTDAD